MRISSKGLVTLFLWILSAVIFENSLTAWRLSECDFWISCVELKPTYPCSVLKGKRGHLATSLHVISPHIRRLEGWAFAFCLCRAIKIYSISSYQKILEMGKNKFFFLWWFDIHNSGNKWLRIRKDQTVGDFFYS